jgi:hypothetical protein
VTDDQADRDELARAHSEIERLRQAVAAQEETIAPPARLRPRLEEILAEHFPPTTQPAFGAMAQRARALADWIIAPMAAAREQYRGTENGGSVVRK